jgi:hypothetical protein
MLLLSYELDFKIPTRSFLDFYLQCGFCAAEFVESEGWPARSDYEDKKLKKNPNARLTCLNPIQGPATIKI